MRAYALIAVMVLAATATAASLLASGQKGHQFTDGQCTTCHLGQGNLRGELKPDVTRACATCHSLGVQGYTSHPTDIEPRMHLPPDMILVDGKVTCVTCHVMHKMEGDKKNRGHYYLRRSVSGKQFCLICHSVDEKGHLFVGATHSGKDKLRTEAFSARVDSTTLLCIECHANYISSIDNTGSGTLQHSTGRLNHPLGIEYERVASKKSNLFTPRSMLREDIVLPDGKIGCGTCHNRFSRHRYMLVMSNDGSALCFSCHSL